MRILLPVSLVAAILALAPSAGAQPPSGSEGDVPKASALPQNPDQRFASDAAQGSMAEIELGTLAGQNAADAEVKKFAQHMVTDHGKALTELKEIATLAKVTLPKTLDVKHQGLKDRLAKLSGPSFDRTYIDEMVAGHQAAVAVFQKQAEGGENASLKAYAAKALPMVEGHLKMALDIQKALPARAQ